MKRRCVLTIAGSDSCAGAGIQADIKSVAACGGYCATVLTAITAQNTLGVKMVEIASIDIVKAQIEAILSDLNITAIKIGMLPSIAIVDAVIEAIVRYDIKNIVLDPVMIATSGDMLVSEDVTEYIIKNLLPHCSLITPNIPEAEFITKLKISNEQDFLPVAEQFKNMKCKSLLLKAGHLESDDLTDYLFNFSDNKTYKHTYKKIDTPNTHGTGCTLSSSIATFLSLGDDIVIATEKAEEYLHKAILTSKQTLGSGHGSVNHLYKLEEL